MCGSLAASAVLTTRTCEKPPAWLAVSLRSTPGRTSGYSALLSCRVGAGSVPGQLSESFLSSWASVASGAEPPPDRASSLLVTFGRSRPSAERVRVVSSSFHWPSRLARTGATFRVSPSVPFGLATTLSVSVVSVGTGTGFPVRLASASAVASAVGG